ncbi:hypothetical protein FOZ61_003237 [Perkinsus olseni]|uniref:Uncharacterized protein n=1 Tax=Perkinsus olseni TaxID=32597 RepID=A0A7J6MVL2_PEROL|nr:hypothetical protein FOZ61_003237 [Perkinsus olseni]KAF4675648.1 hypothetical protein FOL46_000840 [Perkinsus olseni]
MAPHEPRRRSPRLTTLEKGAKRQQHSSGVENRVGWEDLETKDWDCVWEASKLAEDSPITTSPLDFLPSSRASHHDHHPNLDAALEVLDFLETPEDFNRLVESFRAGAGGAVEGRPRSSSTHGEDEPRRGAHKGEAQRNASGIGISSISQTVERVRRQSWEMNQQAWIDEVLDEDGVPCGDTSGCTIVDEYGGVVLNKLMQLQVLPSTCVIAELHVQYAPQKGNMAAVGVAGGHAENKEEEDYWGLVNTCSVWPYDPLFRSPLGVLSHDQVERRDLAGMLGEIDKMKDSTYEEEAVAKFKARRQLNLKAQDAQREDAPLLTPRTSRPSDDVKEVVLSVSPDSADGLEDLTSPIIERKGDSHGADVVLGAGIEPAPREVPLVMTEPLCEPPPHPMVSSEAPAVVDGRSNMLDSPPRGGRPESPIKGVRSPASAGHAGVAGGTREGQAEDATVSSVSITTSRGEPIKRRRRRRAEIVAKAKPKETEEEKEERLKAIRVAIDETKGEVQRQHNKLSKWSVTKGKEESITAAATQPSLRRRSPARSTSSETSSVPVVSDKIKSLSASIKELLGSNRTTTTVEPAEKEETSSRRGVKREAEAAKKRPAKKPRQTKAKEAAAVPVAAPSPDTHGAEEPQSAAAEAPAKIPIPVGSPSSSSGVSSSVVASSPVSSGSALDDLYSALSREMGVE